MAYAQTLKSGLTVRGLSIRKTIVAGAITFAALGAGSLATGSTSWASGVSTGSDAQAMADQAFSYPLQFDASLQTALVELQGADPAATPTVTAFYSSYVTATQAYGVTLLNAAQTYVDTYQTNPANAKNVYIDSFSNARATYFNSLEADRNQVANALSGTNDVAKDSFVNEYNTARDTYNNQLESVKNQIESVN